MKKVRDARSAPPQTPPPPFPDHETMNDANKV